MDDDIFDDDGALTASFLLARGYCCGNGCRNCPYVPRHGGLDSRAPDEALTRGPNAPLREDSRA
jgi:Family of unknown function (DUF5522)